MRRKRAKKGGEKAQSKDGGVYNLLMRMMKYVAQVTRASVAQQG